MTTTMDVDTFLAEREREVQAVADLLAALILERGTAGGLTRAARAIVYAVPDARAFLERLGQADLIATPQGLPS